VNRRRSIGRIFLAVLILLIGVPGWLICRQLRQDSLDKALIAALRNNDAFEAIHLLHQGANANARYELPDPRTPWQRLLDSFEGKPKPQPDRPTATALLIALKVLDNDKGLPYTHTDTALLKALLQHGANVNTPYYGKLTPLFWANSQKNPEAVRLLLEYGADVNAKESNGLTPLYWAVTTYDVTADEKTIVQLMLAHRAQVNTLDNGHSTPLMGATATNRRPDLIRLLLAHGAEVNVSNDQGWTPLLDAITRRQPQTVQLLLAYGAQVHCRTKAGDTPIKLASKTGRNDIVRLLKQAGGKE
jgi:ankyrin repeat protein